MRSHILFISNTLGIDLLTSLINFILITSDVTGLRRAEISWVSIETESLASALESVIKSWAQPESIGPRWYAYECQG